MNSHLSFYIQNIFAVFFIEQNIKDDFLEEKKEESISDTCNYKIVALRFLDDELSSFFKIYYVIDNPILQSSSLFFQLLITWCSN